MNKSGGITFIELSGDAVLRSRQQDPAVQHNAIKASCRWAKKSSAPVPDVWDVLGALGLDDLAQELISAKGH